MRSHLHKSFNKDYKKLTLRIKEKLKIRRNLFLSDSFQSILNNHELHGEYSGCRSINITGDYRAIYFTKGDVAIFIRIGTHSELFGK